jgi:hypothetical protein
MIWGLALVACCAPAQRWRWTAVVIAATAFLIRADGQLVLPRQTAPIMLVLYLGAAAVLWRALMPARLSAPEFAR